ncbi:MAG TPA: prolyl oligopeptidase family serine peptidase [Gemmataceae bacterium]|nr:prolyl oligopeptidase family serine peptidase [Gemmataceae bacterium]
MHASSSRASAIVAALAVVFGTMSFVGVPWSPGSRARAAELEKYVPTPDEIRDATRRPQRPGPAGPVYKARITPHWFHDNTRFWYRNDLRGGTREFILVDAERGTRAAAFDHARLAAALSAAAGTTYPPDKLPFDRIDFTDDGKAVRFRVGDTTWTCDLASYACSRSKADANPLPPEEDQAAAAPSPEEVARLELPWPDGPSPDPEAPATPQRRTRFGAGRSPDGKWVASIQDTNVHLRSEANGREVALTTDGKPGLSYGMLSWAPDSATLAAFRIEPAEGKDVYLIESSPPGGGRARLHTRPYALPGDKFPAYELNLFDVTLGKQLRPAVDRIDFGRPRLRWNKDGRSFTYEKVDRGHQRFRLIEVDAHTGSARNLIDERAKTFIWTAHTESVGVPLVTWLSKTDEILYASERDGWRHLYLIDARDGPVKNQVTKGDYVVRGIDRIDEANRQIWFRASGKVPGQDPYLIHYYRVNFDGTGLVALTAGNGNHSVQFSPDRKYLLDTYSRVDLPPVHELRRTSDGALVCPLEKADVADLVAAGWEPPEVFVAKGRDGTTDIWGVICRPRHFNPARRYPVLESIYAGPQGSFVPKTFNPVRRFASLTDLGFIVVQIDGMGTANRSKAFHDVCWKNLADAGLPDRILWHQAAAKKYPYYDISRVGVFGTSAGGQNAAGAVLFHPDFYKAAVAACGCHDNRMDKASWNEQWMGYPVGPQYAASSNIENAGRLRGKLLLIVGEMDTNVPPESTMRFADALIKAGKDFELLVVPGMGHSNGGAYGVRRMQDFFVRHLHGVEPPDRNAPEPRRPDAGTAPAGTPHVTAPPESIFEKVRERDREAARKFYKKYIDVKGLAAVASAEVADAALRRTYDIVTHLLAGRPDVLAAMVRHGTRLIIIGKDQVYTDMPEYRHHPNPAYQNERVRGTGGFDVTSFGEENLLNLAGDRYDDESIAVHEFCHTIDAALGRIDPGWRKRLGDTYRAALARGLWKNAYTATNPAEYWAEICQSYFDCNRVNNWNHAAVGTREQMKEYDPDGYELVRTTFRLTPANDWRYRPLRKQPSVIAPPARFHFDPYYTKLTYAREFPVLGSARVSDEALLRANDIVRKMFAYRHDILKALITDGARLVVLGRGERLSDLPEFEGAKTEAGFDDVRYLHYAADRKLMVVPEENVLGLPGDPFAGRCMVVSVFARGLYQVCGLRPPLPDFDQRRDKQQYELRVKRLDSDFAKRLRQSYEDARGKGLWKGAAAGRDPGAYWAAGVEAYFDAAGEGPPPDLADHPVTTREALQTYDPDLYALVAETMAYRGHVDWRYRRPAPRE